MRREQNMVQQLSLHSFVTGKTSAVEDTAPASDFIQRKPRVAFQSSRFPFIAHGAVRVESADRKWDSQGCGIPRSFPEQFGMS